jgi:hypothetical protein
LGFVPRAIRNGFSPLRTQNRNPVAGEANASRDRVHVAHVGVQRVEDLGQRMAMRLDAQDVLGLAEGDQDTRRGDEARDDRGG